MTRRIQVTLLVFLILATLLQSWNASNAQSSSSALEEKLITAFEAVSSAESSGGNVSALANLLSEAAALDDKANSIAQSNPDGAQQLYSQADTIASQVISQAPVVKKQGASAQRNAEVAFLGEMSTLGVIAILAYIFVPRNFWNLWLRNHRKWKAKRAITDVQVLAVILVIILIIGLFLSYSYFSARTVSQPYSEIALLGSNQTFSDYPQNVKAGQNLTLYLHVGNYEGHVMFYKILAKIGNSSSVVNQIVFLNIFPTATYSFILSNNKTALRETTLNLNTTGTNLKLVFELWIYSISQEKFVYYNQWTQLLLNVTA